MLNPLKYLIKLFAVVLLIGVTAAVHQPIIAIAKAADGQIPTGTIDSDSVPTLNRVPDFAMTDQKGTEISSADLYGQIWIANFMSTQCKDACAVQIDAMRALQSRLRESGNWEHIRLISIGVDPDHDTSESFADYIVENDLNTTQWHFLSGTRNTIQRLSEGGLKSPLGDDSKGSDVPLMGSNPLVLVDWEGRIRGYYDGSTIEEARILNRDIARVAFERVYFPPAVEKPDWVDGRMRTQISRLGQSDVFSNFKFNDAIENSGVTFRHSVVDDAAIAYKAVHYDHGNAIVVADVDLDGLHDIYFTTQTGSNELWRNLGNGRFENITTEAGLNIDDRIGVAASFADIDNDGDPDLYLTNVRIGNLLFENDGNGHFKDITDHSGTGVKAHSSGATFFDYDRDGLLDLFVSNVGQYTTDTLSNVTHYTDKGQTSSDYQYYVGFKDAFAGHLKPERTEFSVLLKNLGDNRFADVSKDVGLVDSSWSGDATVIDGNSDGWPDLYLLNMQGNDEYYENDQGKRFVRKSRERFPKTPWGSMGIRSFDYDNDGDMDIYVTDMHSDMAANMDGADEKQKMTTHYPESFLRTGGNSLFGNAFYRYSGPMANSFPHRYDQRLR
ncbi:MAG: FG-GAP-like repeat-containing protein [Woeseia sp.]